MKSLHTLPGEAIIARFARESGVSLKDLFSDSRARSIAWPRQDLMRRLRDETDYSLPQIGKLLGRDHSTVLHGIRASQDRGAREAAKKRKTP